MKSNPPLPVNILLGHFANQKSLKSQRQRRTDPHSSVPLRHRVRLVARAGAGHTRGVQRRQQHVRADVPIGRDLQGE